ncbi:L,D-transpeptidase [Salipaludibacillus sp. LMS25]|jgi:lipoprotein-anchoring transpeptidase ErfK/SrfK|uniref:L,D-transpeptidase n=1 Tax=Salipaludibacillus sp. LMS25 TaxID=2924031 RepID=UPI0020D16F6F|nr:L,D-transpeptidase [Salipaludibacillus sp. LMS25]UTR14517.1 L,D-transpeptidase [Salipaludibacillus sp. LMS25]
MASLILSILLIVSPLWPLGENPLAGDPYVIVNTATNELAFIVEGEVKQEFQIATGQENNKTPEGEFNIIVKAMNPYYRKHDIEGGDENNPLGTRWIGFDANGTDGRIFGLHGTNRPTSIGARITKGCVRLNNSDVEVLYEEIPIGTKILIISSEKNFEELGREHGAIE